MNVGVAPVSSGMASAVAGLVTRVHSNEVASSEPLASMVTGWPAIGRVGLDSTAATGRSGAVNGPEVSSGTVAEPPSSEVTVMTCGGASTPPKLVDPPVRSP